MKRRSPSSLSLCFVLPLSFYKRHALNTISCMPAYSKMSLLRHSFSLSRSFLTFRACLTLFLFPGSHPHFIAQSKQLLALFEILWTKINLNKCRDCSCYRNVMRMSKGWWRKVIGCIQRGCVTAAEHLKCPVRLFCLANTYVQTFELYVSM